LQGSLFRKLKAVVMGRKHIDTLKEVPSTVSQEHVEETMDLEDSEDKASTVAQTKRSYAKVVKSRVSFHTRERVRPECKRRKVLTPPTLRQ
jgi:flagellar biogenesis protein FliO